MVRPASTAVEPAWRQLKGGHYALGDFSCAPADHRTVSSNYVSPSMSRQGIAPVQSPATCPACTPTGHLAGRAMRAKALWLWIDSKFSTSTA